MTLWDGDGIDTYDLSNYSSNLTVDLNPGSFSTFSDAQLVDHTDTNQLKVKAQGNVANALLHDGDRRSLIENVIEDRERRDHRQRYQQCPGWRRRR